MEARAEAAASIVQQDNLFDALSCVVHPVVSGVGCFLNTVARYGPLKQRHYCM
jgi:hypothetical protein